MFEKYDRGASKDGYKIVTGDAAWRPYESEIKQQSTVWVFEDKPNPTKVVCGKITSKQMLARSYGKIVYVATAPASWDAQFWVEHYNLFALSLRRNSKNEQEKTNHCWPWQCELSHIGSNQRLFDRPKSRMDGSSTVQPWLDTQWLLFIPAHQEKMRGQRFSSPEDAVESFKNHVLEVSQSECKKCCDKWFERMHV